MSPLKKIFLILMVLVVASSLLSATSQSAAAAVTNCTQWHTVQRGEYLVAIARLYNTDWRTLAEINSLKDPSRIYTGQVLCVRVSGSGTPAPTPGSSTVRVYALSVKEDKYVELQGRNLAANSRYTVYFSRYGALSSSAILVGAAYTDKNGSFQTTYLIPKKLVDIVRIRIDLYNTAGDSASNWFINATASGNTGGNQAPPISFSILAVDKNNSVRIKTSNLPPNVTFDVFMGKAGSQGVKGIQVGTLRDDKGGTVRATFNIPSELQGKAKIDLRIENKRLGWVAYLTFDNKNQ